MAIKQSAPRGLVFGQLKQHLINFANVQARLFPKHTCYTHFEFIETTTSSIEITVNTSRHCICTVSQLVQHVICASALESAEDINNIHDEFRACTTLNPCINFTQSEAGLYLFTLLVNWARAINRTPQAISKTPPKHRFAHIGTAGLHPSHAVHFNKPAHDTVQVSLEAGARCCCTASCAQHMPLRTRRSRVQAPQPAIVAQPCWAIDVLLHIAGL